MWSGTDLASSQSPDVRLDLGVDPGAHVVAERGVRVGVVGRVVLPGCQYAVGLALAGKRGEAGVGYAEEAYALIPRRIAVRNQVTERIPHVHGRRRGRARRRGDGAGLGRGFGRGALVGRCRRRRGGRRLLRVERADLQLRLVLLEDALVVVLPELLRGVLAGDALQDCARALEDPGTPAAKREGGVRVLFWPPAHGQ